MIVIAWILIIPSTALLLLTSIAFLKAKDVFTMTHVVMIFNCYILPLILLAIGFSRFSYFSFAKIIALIILNLIIANLLCYAVVRRATINKITPDIKL